LLEQVGDQGLLAVFYRFFICEYFFNVVGRLVIRHERILASCAVAMPRGHFA